MGFRKEFNKYKGIALKVDDHLRNVNRATSNIVTTTLDYNGLSGNHLGNRFLGDQLGTHLHKHLRKSLINQTLREVGSKRFNKQKAWALDKYISHLQKKRTGSAY